MRSLAAALRLFQAVRWSMARIASRSASIAARRPMSLSDISLSGLSGGGGGGCGTAKGLAYRPWGATTLDDSAGSAGAGIGALGVDALGAGPWWGRATTGAGAAGAEDAHACPSVPAGRVPVIATGSPAYAVGSDGAPFGSRELLLSSSSTNPG